MAQGLTQDYLNTRGALNEWFNLLTALERRQFLGISPQSTEPWDDYQNFGHATKTDFPPASAARYGLGESWSGRPVNLDCNSSSSRTEGQRLTPRRSAARITAPPASITPGRRRQRCQASPFHSTPAMERLPPSAPSPPASPTWSGQPGCQLTACPYSTLSRRHSGATSWRVRTSTLLHC